MHAALLPLLVSPALAVGRRGGLCASDLGPLTRPPTLTRLVLELGRTPCRDALRADAVTEDQR